MQSGELPLFVPTAIVEHAVSLSLTACLGKDVRAAWQEGLAYEMIEAMGVRIRLAQKDRVRMLINTWTTAAEPSIGRSAWFVLVARQSIQRLVTLFYRWLRPGAGKRTSARVS